MAETTAERTKLKEITLPPGATQMFGEYLQQQFEKHLEGVDAQRLDSFLSDMTTKKAILVPKGGGWDFDFSGKEKPIPMPDSVVLDANLTEKFLNAVDHNIGNAAMSIARSNEAAGVAIRKVLNPFSYRSTEIKISRNEVGKVEVTSLTKASVIG